MRPAAVPALHTRTASGRSHDRRAPASSPSSPTGIEMTFATGHRWSLRTSFWLVVSAQVLLFAGSNFPTPLFPIYEQRYGFGSGVVTLLFGVYVVGADPDVAAARAGLRPGRPPAVAGRGHRRSPSVSSLRSRRPERRLALRGRDHLRHRRRHGDVVRGRRDPRAAPQTARAPAARWRRRSRPAAGLALGPLVSGLLASIDAVADRVALRARHRARRALAVALMRIPETRPTARRRHRARAISTSRPHPGHVRRDRNRGRGQLHGRRLGVRLVALVPARGAARPRHPARRGRLVRGARRSWRTARPSWPCVVTQRHGDADLVGRRGRAGWRSWPRPRW